MAQSDCVLSGALLGHLREAEAGKGCGAEAGEGSKAPRTGRKEESRLLCFSRFFDVFSMFFSMFFYHFFMAFSALDGGLDSGF